MCRSETEILKQYKEYDYLNKNRERPLVKILVSYIKPAFLFKSEILTPIHLGRAVERESSKGGTISDEDIKWLHENCIGDDDFEDNISAVNRRVGFLTGTYWAWKNYDKLGNPEYFGSFGYRRLFEPNILNNIKQYDCIFLKEVDFSKTGPTIEEHVAKLQGEKTLRIMLDIFNEIYAIDKCQFNEYLKQTSAYMYEMYIMKKEIFFYFCDWIFPLLFNFLTIPSEKFGFKNVNSIGAKFVMQTKEMRNVAYLMEIITGYFCYKLYNHQHLKIKLSNLIYLESKAQKNNRNLIIAKLLQEKLRR